MLRKAVPVAAAATLAIGIAACGEDRSGDVKFEGDTGTNTTSTSTTGTAPETTETAPKAETETTP